MAGITFSEEEIKNLLFALASAKAEDYEEKPEPMKKEEPKDSPERKKDDEDEDPPLDKEGRVDTKEMLRRKLEKK